MTTVQAAERGFEHDLGMRAARDATELIYGNQSTTIKFT
jgi:hypothetical protein